MLLGRRSNEEASVPRLRSGFFITSCAVVTPPQRDGWAVTIIAHMTDTKLLG